MQILNIYNTNITLLFMQMPKTYLETVEVAVMVGVMKHVNHVSGEGLIQCIQQFHKMGTFIRHSSCYFMY
jgi:hypothetical protein